MILDVLPRIDWNGSSPSQKGAFGHIKLIWTRISMMTKAMNPPRTILLALFFPQISLVTSVHIKVIEYAKMPAGTNNPNTLIILFAKIDAIVMLAAKTLKIIIKIRSVSFVDIIEKAPFGDICMKIR